MKTGHFLLSLALLAGCEFVIPSNAHAADPVKFSDEQRSHWAFQKVARPVPPKVGNPQWNRNPVDAFILAELEARKLRPSAPADKATLLRRASLDLIGLPPTPEELAAFLADDSPQAFEKVVDRLLASPHYGERWARHWLDLARYAESEGFKADETRPNAWRFRDYVIQSFNSDKPYNRFVQEQIAGDEMWPDQPEALVATGFNRHYADESNARILSQRRQDILNDITDTVGGVFLGMTYACCRCHDHKYEPILQADYYRLQAFFANSAARDDIPLVMGEQAAAYRARLAVWEEKTRDIREKMAALEAPKQRELEKDYFDKYPDDIQAILKKPEADRNPFEKQMAWKARQYLDPSSHQYVGALHDVLPKLKGAEKLQWQRLKTQLDQFADLYPGEMPIATGIIDLGRQAPPTHVLNHGGYDNFKEEVQPGFLSILDPGDVPCHPPAGLESTGRRTALANLLTDPANPLPARVMVNRLWQHHFGRGLVATPSDLGVHGDRPTHPALLDWLASEFVRNGWSLKQMHRLIMTSQTYQQASSYREEAAQIDPANKLLWHFPRQRLEGEVIRDAGLSVAGLLNPKMGGPSIFPELPAGMPAPRGGWSLNQDQDERNRRSVYVFVRRNSRYPMFDAFDMPDPHESCPRRNVTTSPIQALTLLNDKLTLEWAQNLAGRVLETAGGADVDGQMDTAFRLTYSRAPDKAEQATVRDFFSRQTEIVAARKARGEKLAVPLRLRSGTDLVRAAVLVDLCHTLLNANEFVYEN